MSEEERGDVEALRAFCDDVQAVQLPKWRSWWNCALTAPTAAPLQSAYCWQPELLARILAAADSADVIHVEHLRGARYGLAIKAELARRGRSTPVIWDSVDSISLLFRQAAAQSRSGFGRWITRFELARTERYEGWLLGQFGQVVVTSDSDRKALLELANGRASQASIRVIPNGVNTDYFRPNPAVERQPATLVFSGKMSYHANVTAALHLINDIMPHVWAERPDTQVVIAGKDPTPHLRSLAERHAQRVMVTGTVPDIRPYLWGATVAVAPIVYGAGIQNKVLEAMACATPVIATPRAVGALGAQQGQEVLVAQQPEAFAQTVLEVLADPSSQRQIGAAGLRYVETRHTWDQAAAQLENMYHDYAVVHG
jgi:glycosyltransferase involved in cell wall biosynthesis